MVKESGVAGVFGKGKGLYLHRIEGNCLAGGLEIALCCDLLYAKESARMGVLLEVACGDRKVLYFPTRNLNSLEEHP
ncbi:MAG: hypothetical protein ACP5SH_08595 [Syntrophobacteraceae bacterium]